MIMDLHQNSYRNDDYTKMNNSTTIRRHTTTNVYMFLYVIFNVSVFKNTASNHHYLNSSKTLMISPMGSVPTEILSNSDFKPMFSR